MMPRWLEVLRLRIRSLTHRRQVEAELDREVQAHLEGLADEHMAHGMTPADARRAALRDFGPVDDAKEESRDARRVAFAENLLRDLRYTLRGLKREPMLLLTATASIALGAAGNLAVFSMARAIAFGTPDLRDPDRVVAMRVSHTSHVSYQRWRDLDASGALDRIVGYDWGGQVNWFQGDATVAVASPMVVTANFFDVLGLPLALGRGFTEREARAEDDPHLAVVSHTFWQRELGADPNVLGRRLILDGGSYTIVGVLAPRLQSLAILGIAPPLYLPLNRSRDPDVLARGAQRVQLVGRLKPGQSAEAARAALDAVDRRLARAAGDTLYGGVQEFGPVGSGGDSKFRRIRAFFSVLAVVSGLVLLIACGNVAGLLMARGTARRPEIAIRLAIGGTRWRIVQQLMAEAFWLALIGTVAGLGLSLVAMRTINAISLPIALPIELHLGIDRPVLLAAVALVMATMVACALVPALGATRPSLLPALQRDEPWRVGRRLTMRGLLLAGQVTVSTVLLATALLFVRNLQRSHLTDPGFDVDGVMVSEIGFIRAGAQNAESQRLLLERMAERARTLPGAGAVAIGTAVPLTTKSGSSSGRSVQFEAKDRPEHVEFFHSEVGTGWFATLGIRLLAGRDFGATDRSGSPAVVVVNDEFARRYLNGRAVGRRFRFADSDADKLVEYEIVGVVSNSKSQTIGEEPRGAIYFPLAQHPSNRAFGFVFVRSTGDEAVLAGRLESELSAVDRSVSVEVQPMRSALTFALLPSRLGAVVLGSLGLMGLILAACGLLAVVSYTVARRSKEIAIRAALGATRGRILRLVLRDSSVLVGVAVAVGLGIAALATRGLSTFLVAGLEATDPISFLGTAAVFLLVAILASWIPARRGLRVDPAAAIRVD
jgi:predicted permease